MTVIATDRPESITTEQVLLVDRFILAQVGSKTLVFPANWVAEIFRIDRSQILDLPFYDRLLVGIVDRAGQIIPLIAATQLLEIVQPSVSERLVVVRLLDISSSDSDRSSESLENIGLIVDRLIATTTRAQLPVDLFSQHHSAEMVMMRLALVPTNIWQPQS
jgi:chemotaxis signal transduction protein